MAWTQISSEEDFRVVVHDFLCTFLHGRRGATKTTVCHSHETDNATHRRRITVHENGNLSIVFMRILPASALPHHMICLRLAKT